MMMMMITAHLLLSIIGNAFISTNYACVNLRTLSYWFDKWIMRINKNFIKNWNNMMKIEIIIQQCQINNFWWSWTIENKNYELNGEDIRYEIIRYIHTLVIRLPECGCVCVCTKSKFYDSILVFSPKHIIQISSELLK